eukprot:GHVU01082000.1.p2 GENE.GHVU01082000.1~~GHVU01082000.1.p2  ORF type:complete len:200 (-),score=13.27 GHVU01082000.1:154-753(-)
MGLELHRVKQTMKPQVQQRIKPIAQHAHTHTYIRTHAYTHVDIREMREYGLECVPREIGVDDQLGAGPHCCRLPRIKHLPVATLREGTPLGAQKRVREVSIEDKFAAHQRKEGVHGRNSVHDYHIEVSVAGSEHAESDPQHTQRRHEHRESSAHAPGDPLPEHPHSQRPVDGFRERMATVVIAGEELHVISEPLGRQRQ